MKSKLIPASPAQAQPRKPDAATHSPLPITPLPWHVELATESRIMGFVARSFAICTADRVEVARFNDMHRESEGNAQLCVRACNNAQRLADVAKQAMEFAIYIIEENAEPTLEECVDVREAAREALAEWSK